MLPGNLLIIRQCLCPTAFPLFHGLAFPACELQIGSRGRLSRQLPGHFPGFPHRHPVAGGQMFGQVPHLDFTVGTWQLDGMVHILHVPVQGVADGEELAAHLALKPVLGVGLSRVPLQVVVPLPTLLAELGL